MMFSLVSGLGAAGRPNASHNSTAATANTLRPIKTTATMCLLIDHSSVVWLRWGIVEATARS